MAIPKKGSRNITIGAQRFRWVVSIHNNSANLVVELADDPGQRLQAYFECRDLHVRDSKGEWRFHSQKQSIMPAHVRRVITHALADGWEPDRKGAAPYDVRDAARIALTIDVERIDNRNVAPDSNATYIKEVGRDFISTYMALSLCMDGIHNQKSLPPRTSATTSLADVGRCFRWCGLGTSLYPDEPGSGGCDGNR